MDEIKKNKTLKTIHDALKDSKLNDSEILTLRNILKARYPSSHLQGDAGTGTMGHIRLAISMSKDFSSENAAELIDILTAKFPNLEKSKEKLPENMIAKMFEEVGKLRAGKIASIDGLVSLHKDYESLKVGQTASR